MDEMLKLAAIVYEALGADSPRRFITECAIFGMIFFAILGWLTVKGYEANLRRNPPPITHTTGDATTHSDKSPAITGDGNGVTYGNPPDTTKQPPKEPPK
jgi:hypothetical protein